MNVLTRLRMGEGFSDGERALADAILADPEAFLDNGSKQLTARAHVSKSTVYRLCEKLDCPGLADLRVRVASALADFRRASAGVDVNFPVRAGQNGARSSRRYRRTWRRRSPPRPTCSTPRRWTARPSSCAARSA